MDGYQYTAEFEAPDGQPVLAAYPDPLTKSEPWTVGLGHTGPDVKEGAVWTEDQCWAAFYNDYAIAQADAAHIAGTSCWAKLTDPRKAVLTDMAFQMGAGGLSGFHSLLTGIRFGEWEMAKAALLDSAYARQTQSRAETNAQTLLTGNWPSQAIA